MIGHLTTHVLDTANGCPGSGMHVTLFRLDDAGEHKLGEFVLNSDGRSDNGPMLSGEQFQTGKYRLLFQAGRYFRSKAVPLPEPLFIDAVPIDFGIADSDAHYHVPLLVSPWSYATYRGS